MFILPSSSHRNIFLLHMVAFGSRLYYFNTSCKKWFISPDKIMSWSKWLFDSAKYTNWPSRMFKNSYQGFISAVHRKSFRSIRSFFLTPAKEFLEPCWAKFLPCVLDPIDFVKKIANVQCDFVTFIGQLDLPQQLPKILLSTLGKHFVGCLQQSFSRTSSLFQLVRLPKLATRFHFWWFFSFIMPTTSALE